WYSRRASAIHRPKRRRRGKSGDALVGPSPVPLEDRPRALRAGDEQSEDGHGRHEERHAAVIYDPEGSPPGWPGVVAVVVVGRSRRRWEETPARPHTTSPSRGGRRRARATGRSALGGGDRTVAGARRVRRRGLEPEVVGPCGANLGLIRRVAAALLQQALRH